MLAFEHLSDADLALLARATGEEPRPRRLDALLGRREVFEALFRSRDRDPFLQATPFLVFAVLVYRSAQELAEAAFIQEWVRPRERVPVFDVAALRDFLNDPGRRYFLAEVLASYTRVSSGSVWVRTRRGWRRRRYSELSPVGLAQLLEVVPQAERPAVYRRLGDLALFLSGVFPDYAGGHLLREIDVRRLIRTLERDRGWMTPVEPPSPTTALESPIWLFEWMGRRAYRLAWRAGRQPEGAASSVLEDVGQRFGQARRILNFLTDRHLFLRREQWFGSAG